MQDSEIWDHQNNCELAENMDMVQPGSRWSHAMVTLSYSLIKSGWGRPAPSQSLSAPVGRASQPRPPPSGPHQILPAKTKQNRQVDKERTSIRKEKSRFVISSTYLVYLHIWELRLPKFTGPQENYVEDLCILHTIKKCIYPINVSLLIALSAVRCQELSVGPLTDPPNNSEGGTLSSIIQLRLTYQD